MPRPCMKRRESTAANRRSRPNPKPSGPPPIRHKKKQKAIHNARRGRGRGGGPSRNQRSGDGMAANQDYISFGSTPSNFHLLNGGGGSRHDPIDLDDEDSDSESDEYSEGSDSDVEDSGAMTINVQVEQGRRVRARRAEVMFPMGQAIAIYRGLHSAGFPLFRPDKIRFGREEPVEVLSVSSRNSQREPAPLQYANLAFRSDTAVGGAPTHVGASHSNSSSNISPAPTNMSRQPSTSTVTSRASTRREDTSSTGRDYVFDWGIHSGKHFTQIPEPYLRTIAGNAVLFDKHPGFKEALDYHRPGMRRSSPAPPSRPATKQQNGGPVQAPLSRGRSQAEPAQGFPRGRPGQHDPTPRHPPRQEPVQAPSRHPPRQPASEPSRPLSRQEPVQAPSRGTRNQGTRPPAPTRPVARKSWTTYTFPKGAHMDKKLNEVPANYLKTLEGMEHVMNRWTGLREALDDYYAKTGGKR